MIVRYFGGTKLGVGGLISAYRTAAQYALEASVIVEKTINLALSISFAYKDLNKVLRIIKDNNVTVSSRKMEFDCEFVISIRKNDFKKVKLALENLRCLVIKEL